MDSPNPINFQAHAGRVAQAYGARPPARVGSPQSTPQVGKASIGPDGVIRPPYQQAAPQSGRPSGARNGAPSGSDAFAIRQDRVSIGGPAPLPEPIEQLIAGQVDSPVSRGEGFAEPPARPANAPARSAYAMYTRAADRVEVATSIAVGRSLDARG
jgi:hypothetical protein